MLLLRIPSWLCCLPGLICRRTIPPLRAWGIAEAPATLVGRGVEAVEELNVVGSAASGESVTSERKDGCKGAMDVGLASDTPFCIAADAAIGSTGPVGVLGVLTGHGRDAVGDCCLRLAVRTGVMLGTDADDLNGDGSWPNCLGAAATRFQAGACDVVAPQFVEETVCIMAKDCECWRPDLFS